MGQWPLQHREEMEEDKMRDSELFMKLREIMSGLNLEQ